MCHRFEQKSVRLDRTAPRKSALRIEKHGSTTSTAKLRRSGIVSFSYTVGKHQFRADRIIRCRAPAHPLSIPMIAQQQQDGLQRILPAHPQCGTQQ